MMVVWGCFLGALLFFCKMTYLFFVLPCLLADFWIGWRVGQDNGFGLLEIIFLEEYR